MGLRQYLTSAYFPKHHEQRAHEHRSPGAIVLMYHEVLPDEVNLPNWSIVQESQFRSQSAYLKKHYQVLTLDELRDQLTGKPTYRLTKKPMVAITFDDGYSGNFNYAAPILRDMNLPFTVYVATAQIERGGLHWYDKVMIGLLKSGRRSIAIPTSAGTIRYSPNILFSGRRWAAINDVLTKMKILPVEERELIATELCSEIANFPLSMLSTSELSRLADDPLATVGCHTHGHELLDRIPLADAKASILRAQELLKIWTGQTAMHFSYPNGNFSPQVTELVRDIGFSTAVTTQQATWSAGTDPLRIPRIGIGRFDNMNLFRAKVAGLLSRCK